MSVGIDLEFAQQPLGTFAHLVTQGGRQGLQTACRVSSPQASLGDADALVADETFQTYRRGDKVVHAFSLSRQQHATDQAERDGILRVVGQHAAHHQRAHGAGRVAQPGDDRWFGWSGQIVEMPDRIGAQLPVQKHRRIRPRRVQTQTTAEDVAPRRVHVQETVGHRGIDTHARPLDQQLGHPAAAVEASIDLARPDELLHSNGTSVSPRSGPRFSLEAVDERRRGDFGEIAELQARIPRFEPHRSRGRPVLAGFPVEWRRQGCGSMAPGNQVSLR